MNAVNPGYTEVERSEPWESRRRTQWALWSRKKPKPQVTPNVQRDEYKNQLEVTVPNLRVRTAPSVNAEVIGYASIGFYNYYETKDADNYTWYRIADNQWVASSGEWTKIYPAKPKDKYIQFKLLSEKDGYVEIDLGKVFVKNK